MNLTSQIPDMDAQKAYWEKRIHEQQARITKTEDEIVDKSKLLQNQKEHLRFLGNELAMSQTYKLELD